ncbi:YceI family protein [Dinghuibacter silviterrae]|uniref:Polyisoprenoid-binding protein YceI n=1 Tax=Dinghuibacter silviterrae TaxID=1539049 RepID=A0A4R8DRQ2_9BACT|nr:YceI family protein [Dinghuibacter silviterrae]TDX00892.1 polyisoprenoid-binding protein YceI [Dinghuibacter silviterrae]
MLAQEVSTKTAWSIDPMHSQIGFKVKHLMFTNVRGSFGEYVARISTWETDFATAEIDLTISAASIDTNDEKRDGHLKSPDFFDVANFGELTFKSHKIEQKGTPHDFVLHGDLTIKGTTLPVTLNAEFSGVLRDPWGNEKAAFILQGKINRKDFGLGWNAALETGGVLIGEEVTLDIEVQLAKEV